jgi:aryl-alcohol dehydrogenase-like predicted oxidoreductase
MKQIVIHNTDIHVSRFALGTASLHHLFSSALRKNILIAAASVGFTHFDTSPYYGLGLAECDLGTFLMGQRSHFTVATKVGLYPWGTAASHAAGVWARKALGRVAPAVSLPVVNWQVDRARASLQQSLKRLKTDYVDFLFLHEPDENLIIAEEFMRWIESEVTQGTVRSWGLAGEVGRVAPWVWAAHPLAKVIQTQDELVKRQADFMLASGRCLQFTYGYLSSQPQSELTVAPETILRTALVRNSTGAIIVSTRRAERLQELARLAA